MLIYGEPAIANAVQQRPWRKFSAINSTAYDFDALSNAGLCHIPFRLTLS